jgi:hypothetical protein
MKKFRVIAVGTSSVVLAGLAFATLQQKYSPEDDLSPLTAPLSSNRSTLVALEEVTPENIVFPDDGGVINVKNSPYNAKGDGVSDDTIALQQALNDYPNKNKIIYLPTGTYLVSDRLQWPEGEGGNTHKRTILQGQNTGKTIVKLKNSAQGFGNVLLPKAVIWTGEAPAQRFRNAIRNLTVDTGTGNAGAIAIQFIANNQGTIRNVTMRSPDGQGMVGLDMAYTDEIGPLLVKNVKVDGFNIGIKTANRVNSQTFEHLKLQNQKQYGLANYGQNISIRDLQSNNPVPAIYNEDGVVTLIDANLTNSSSRSQPAIKNDSILFTRNLKTSGYFVAIENNQTPHQKAMGTSVDEFVSHQLPQVSSTAKSLNLPVEETPEIAWDDLSNWGSPTHFGAVSDDRNDDSAAIQAAIDSGKTTIYLPNGSYLIEKTIYIRKNVKRIIGLEARIEGKGSFRFEDGNAPTVIIERLDGIGSGIIHATSRTLVLSSMSLGVSGYQSSYSNIGKGKLFLEDVVGGPWQFNNQKVWARQLNPENSGTHISNNAGNLWVLGLKTERDGILVESKAGAKTEILGGFIYSTDKPKTTPMFVSNNSNISITIGECNFNRNFYLNLVEEIRKGKKIQINRGNTPQRCNGSILPLYVSPK